MPSTNTKVDAYISKSKQWQRELIALRRIVLDCGLTEQLKWRQPCYTLENSNVIILAETKQHCVLSFIKGALLKDPQGLLVKPGENTQAGRVIRFCDSKTIIKLEAALRAYILEAIEVEKAGLKVELRKPDDFSIPDELQFKFNSNAELKTAFFKLTPGRQRAYVIHFNAAKQSTTRDARIDRYTQHILCGKGMNDCVCGLSKKMPACDGSHNQLK